MSNRTKNDVPMDPMAFHMPKPVLARLHFLLDRQDSGHPLTKAEFEEAEELVELADLMTLLRMRAERAAA